MIHYQGISSQSKQTFKMPSSFLKNDRKFLNR